MQRVRRVVLVWVMVFAMPLQGFAATVMLFCGPSHARMLQALTIDAPDQAAAHGAHAAQAAGHAVAQADASADCPHAAAAATADPSPPQGQVTCSACAACCAAFALPARPLMPEPASPAPLPPLALVEPVASHQPDGLDRPPRTVLA